MLRADVPVGSYLSGGLDSSLIATLGLRAKGERFQTFSLRFEDAEYDETSFQRLMARHLGSDHHEVLVSRADIAEAFPDVVTHTERPILRTAPAPLFLLSKLVRTPASRSSSPERAPTRCSRGTTCSARPRSAASGRASRPPPGDRACWSGCIPTCSGRRCRSWRSPAVLRPQPRRGRHRVSATTRGGVRRRALKRLFAADARRLIGWT